MSLYDASGLINITSVNGSVFTGLRASDGSINVVIDDSSSRGVYHPCGAFRVNSSAGTTSAYDSTGAFYYNFLLGRGTAAISTGPSGDGSMDFSIATGDNTGLLILIEDI